ncbi:hypothetical protein AAW00_10670 [Aurantiacibacter luteus]|uniref:DUF427 domain-containing protein n=1 Tax=Aurantiacibacter luteus TaxID=1581420 RepID=A0A0G9MVC4_9SPHN|nr:DUF427 domain-containing protein [Aurantiacibacter luteus]KLE34635.1 hypothetical protein AAW00_10670 [Aurantiacibacter luteus]
MRRWRDLPGPGQISVWDFPRPAIARAGSDSVVIEHGGIVIARTRSPVLTFETSHPPSYYIPPGDIMPGVLRRAEGSSFCEWKGAAVYWDVITQDGVQSRVAWSYPNPSPPFAMLRDHVAFFAGSFDRCSVNGETVVPQPGQFYGGWITSRYSGPFKGIPGSTGW